MVDVSITYMTIGTNEAGPTSILRRPLIWLNLLCLDAPLVAISWQWLFMRVFQVAAPIAEREGLFLTAWLIYLIDRLADSLSLSTGVPKSVRQDFCSRHKYLWVGLIAVIALLDAETIFFRVGHETFVYGIFLGAIAGIYLTINHGFSKLWRKIPIKELIVGFLFATGTLLLFVPQVLAARSTIAFAAALFAGLCALNCMAIAAWERNLDRAQSKHSIATRWPRAKIWTQFLSLLLSGACIILFFFDREFWPIASCLGLSAILLFALHFLPVRTDERAALADLVLLTPLVFAFVEKFL